MRLAVTLVAIKQGSHRMPNDVKAYVSAAIAVAAIFLAYWSGSPVRPEFANIVLATAAFMIVAMWIFPEAGGKKKAPKD